MNPSQYLRGDDSHTVVQDLNAMSAEPLEVVLVLESPHSDELISGLPLSGDAGKLALSYVQNQTRSSEGLGPWLRQKLDVGITRVAIMNVSQVPLQENAYSSDSTAALKPSLTAMEWNELERIRTKPRSVWTPRELRLGEVLRDGLQRRMTRLNLASGALIVPCGKFAASFVSSVKKQPGSNVLAVRHPSNRWWQRSTAQAEQDLQFMRAALLKAT